MKRHLGCPDAASCNVSNQVNTAKLIAAGTNTQTGPFWRSHRYGRKQPTISVNAVAK